MTPLEITAARATLGHLWGLNRPLTKTELGRALKLNAQRPNDTVLQWENGERAISGILETAIKAMLAGYKPEHF